jgi:hypothetical protein
MGNGHVCIENIGTYKMYIKKASEKSVVKTFPDSCTMKMMKKSSEISS